MISMKRRGYEKDIVEEMLNLNMNWKKRNEPWKFNRKNYYVTHKSFRNLCTNSTFLSFILHRTSNLPAPLRLRPPRPVHQTIITTRVRQESRGSKRRNTQHVVMIIS